VRVELRRGDQHARHHLVAPRLRAAPHRDRPARSCRAARSSSRPSSWTSTSNDTLDLGIAYHGGAPVGRRAATNDAVYGGNNHRAVHQGLPAELEGAGARRARPRDRGQLKNLFGTGLSIPAFGVVLHALGKDGNSNVLATPHILATDNVQAEISIGQNIPLQTNVGGARRGSRPLAEAGAQARGRGAAAASAGSAACLGGFGAGRQDVGTKLKVKPHINDSDQVRLELNEEISEVGASRSAPWARSRSTSAPPSTTLIVRDQQTVVIGGLVRDQRGRAPDEGADPRRHPRPRRPVPAAAPRPCRRRTCSSS
jgi:general secretion pathway protein D